MRKFKIDFIQKDILVEVTEGTTLLEAEIAAGLTPDAPCGGKGSCGKCKRKVNGKVLLACQTKVFEDMEVEDELAAKEDIKILTDGSKNNIPFCPQLRTTDLEEPLLAAVDLGSTTVVVYLLDGVTGELLTTKSMLNPQRQYGADVVMRCNYALENGGEVLSTCIQNAISLLLQNAANECGRNADEIVRVMMVGNSGMHHLFLGISTKTLALAPYEPKVSEAVQKSAIDYGLFLHPKAQLCWLPNIGGFVGADTVGCLLATQMDQMEAMTLLVDIGTNGEIVLGNHDGLYACSTAAGPAFEGARITCGMRGSKGAIDHVYLEDHKLKYHVIGEGEPKGICGSGILDAAACLLVLGVIDKTGRMEETYYFTPNVYLTQKDIRELQLAKAAIAAGIKILCKARSIHIDDIAQVLIAGAFGNYMNPESACAIGLLPKELQGRIFSIGNAAGAGAQIAARNWQEYERSSQLAMRTKFVELALDPEFQDIYVDELEF